MIQSMPGVTGDALAHELSKLLPTVLQQQRGQLYYRQTVEPDAAPEADEGPTSGDHERRRA